MPTSTSDERIKNVKIDENLITVDLMDGRIISVPLVWYPSLMNATPEQLMNWEIAGGGYGIHWPDLDEDLSTEGFLRGAPSPKKFNKTA
ncbi:MAG: DUF2442 domain-containing protein [Ignavibacteriales bacterium]|jgi:hypothetical protein|nr:DUF2442 domain-containing protein [Ignavibacteriales bacterium]MBP9122723.1 DUF2442 domain-containing protein [Ignavibacteriaceae bacterium]